MTNLQKYIQIDQFQYRILSVFDKSKSGWVCYSAVNVETGSNVFIDIARGHYVKVFADCRVKNKTTWSKGDIVRVKESFYPTGAYDLGFVPMPVPMWRSGVIGRAYCEVSNRVNGVDKPFTFIINDDGKKDIAIPNEYLECL